MKGDTKALFKRNLEILKSLDKTLWEKVRKVKDLKGYKVFPSRSGPPTLRIGDTLIHSAYDPEGEGKRWAEYHLKRWDGFSIPLVFGFGLGYHVLKLNNLINQPFLVIEPDLRVFRIALEYVDLSSLVEKVCFLIEPVEEEISRVVKGSFHIMPHPSTTTLNQATYRLVERRIKLSQRYRILVVGPIYGGSLPIAGYCASSLKRLGYEVEYVDLSLFDEAFQSINRFTPDEDNKVKLKGLFTMFLSEVVMARVVEFKPDLVFALAQAPLTNDLLNRLRGYKIPTAFWFVEDFRTMDYWRDIAPLYDYFFTIQDGVFFDSLRDRGVKNFHYLPLASAPAIHKPLKLSSEEIDEYKSDLSFVGAGYYNRRNLFSHLLDFDLKIWGNEWEGAYPLFKYIQREGRRISTEDSVKVFNASKININLHSSKQHEGVNPYGDFVNPRTFEIAACGGFQLVDYRAHLPRFFKIDEEVVCFKDVDDLRKKIRYYLDHPDEREEIARMARNKAVKDHTYEKRMEEMMGFLLDRGFEGTSSIPGRPLVRDMVREAGITTSLGRYLSRFLNRRSITLEEIVEEIHKGKGSLSREESIFLMMNEFKYRKG